MIPVHTPRVNNHFMRNGRLTDQFATTLAHITPKHLIAVLRDPDQMIFAVPNCVAAAFVRFHVDNLHGRRVNPMPPKGVGFPDPLSGTLKPRHFRSVWNQEHDPHD